MISLLLSSLGKVIRTDIFSEVKGTENSHLSSVNYGHGYPL